MNYITFYEKYRKASPDGGEYTYCIPEQSDTPEARKEYLLYLYEEKGYPVDMRDIDVGNKYSDLEQLRSKLDRIEAKLKELVAETRIDPFEFVEPCEPDCDDVRHAYHKGQWDMATRIEAQQEANQ